MTRTAPQPAADCVTVIPALDEAATISDVVVGAIRFAAVIVVDDGSGDGTGEIARRAGAEVIVHPVPRGYDAALESGLEQALARGFRFAVTMDADGQHAPALLGTFFAELQGGADLVAGVRDRRQRIAETLFGWVAQMAWGLRDPLCGMKGYRLTLLRVAGRFDSCRSVGTELAVRIARSRGRIAQVRVPTPSRAGVSRFGDGWAANYRILRALTCCLFRAGRLPKVVVHAG